MCVWGKTKQKQKQNGKKEYVICICILTSRAIDIYVVSICDKCIVIGHIDSWIYKKKHTFI